ncbi:MAG: DNA mismatch repair protein [Myxococcales bacterium]|nr:DNA mismatch repair protein [Myxococcales bacterium]
MLDDLSAPQVLDAPQTHPDLPSAHLTPAGCPDLLNGRGRSRLALDDLRTSVTLAFAGGSAGGLFREALAQSRGAASNWSASAFASDLFLAQFVTQCLPVRVDGREFAADTGHLARCLASPPTDDRIVSHRRGCLAELVERPALRRALEQVYLSLRQYRSLLEGASGSGRWDANRRRLDLLKLIHETFEQLANNFHTATSGLRRLADFAEAVRGGETYRSLGDLLRYDQNFASVSLKVGVGADGRIRGFELLQLEEDQQNPFANSVLRRWLVKLELFVRGYQFSDGEVMAHLIDGVFEGMVDHTLHFIELIVDIEFYLGALGFRDLALQAGLGVSLPDFSPPESPRHLSGLFNPLLLASQPRVVPCDVTLDHHATTLLITGPNSGGKTRLLQSLGLAQVMGQSGLFIPAAGGSICAATSLVVSLLQDTHADQSEGRLGMELMRIRELFQHLPPGAMVILDELCSGTNPSEGEEIFELVVKMLGRLEPQVFITTHFLNFAERLRREGKIPGLTFLQVELGADQAPTYQFVPGVARTSLAGQTAARLGVTAAQLNQLVDANLQRNAS